MVKHMSEKTLITFKWGKKCNTYTVLENVFKNTEKIK